MIVDTSTPQPQAIPTPGVRSSQDIVDHLDKVLAAQPPEVKAAVDHAHGIMGLQSPIEVPASDAASPMAASAPVSAPEVPQPITASPVGASPIVAAGSPTDAQPLPTPGISAGSTPAQSPIMSGSPSPYAKPGPYATQLSPDEEPKFQSWVKSGNIPFDNSPTSDYDMRGYWKARQAGDGGAQTKTSEFDGKPHFPDTYKTPYHKTFSGESQYATSDAPHWVGDKLIGKDGSVVADETPAAPPAGSSPIVASGSPKDVQPLPTPKAATPSTAAPLPNPHMQNLERMTTEGTGTNKIHNPFLRGLATVGDAIGSGLFPEFTRYIPGTSAHHQQLIGEEEGQVEQEQKAAKSAADVAHTTAQTGHEAAGEKYENQQADTLAEEGKRAPKADLIAVGDGLYDAKAARWIKEPSDKDKEKLVAVDPAYGQSHHLVPDKDGKYYIPPQSVSELLKPATVKEGEQPLGPRVKDINAAMTARYQVLHPGVELPKHFLLPDEATQKDFDRTDKLLEGEEKAFGTKANQDQTAELRKQTMALANANREHKDETAIKTASHKAFTPALDSGERFNVMTKNYEDAVKNHDQQAMLSLLANHLGMTMGLQKGARMTKDIIHEAEVSRPWLQGLKAKFDKDGYLSGVNLTPEQMRQMVSLGRERFAEDISKSRSEAKYMGSSDDGPDRIPSKATINHYLGEANGDLKKAKELATTDGWTVK